MSRPPENPLDTDSRAILAHRRLLMQSFRMRADGPHVSETELRRAILGENISEQSRLMLERAFLFPLRFADREAVDQCLSVDSESSHQNPESESLHPGDYLDADLVYRTADQFYLASEFWNALTWFKRSLELFDRIDPTKVALSKVKIASCYSFLDQSRDAIELLEDSVSFLEGISDRSVVADAHEGLGVVRLIRGEFGSALYHYESAFEAAKNSSPVIAGNAQYGIARVEATRAIIMGNRDVHFDNSMHMAFQLYAEGESTIGEANCNLVRGFMKIVKPRLSKAIEWKRRLNDAIEWLNRARELYEQAENALGQALCYEILGDLYTCGRLHEKAIEHRGRAWALFPRTGSKGYSESRKDRMRLEHMLIQTGYSRLLLAQYLRFQ